MKAVNRLHINDADFNTRLEQLLAWESVSDDNVAKAVADILERVRLHGDSALLELTNQYDDRQVESAEQLEICLLYTSPSPRDRQKSRMPSSA